MQKKRGYRVLAYNKRSFSLITTALTVILSYTQQKYYDCINSYSFLGEYTSFNASL